MTEGGKWHCWRRNHDNWKPVLYEYQGQAQNKGFRIRRTCQGRKEGAEPSAHTTLAYGGHYDRLPFNIWRKLNLREVKPVLFELWYMGK